MLLSGPQTVLVLARTGGAGDSWSIGEVTATRLGVDPDGLVGARRAVGSRGDDGARGEVRPRGDDRADSAV